MGDMRPRRDSSFIASFFTSSGMPGFFDLLAQVFDFALALVLLAQLLLDGLHLLAQIVVALRLLHLVLHFALDLGAKLLHLDFLGQVLVEQFEPAGTLAVSSSACLSSVVRNGSEEATKSTRRLGSSILPAMVRNSSDKRRRFGDDLLELADHVAHQRFDRCGGFPVRRLRRVSTSAIMNGSVWT